MEDPGIFLFVWIWMKVLVKLLLLVAEREKLIGMFGVSPNVYIEDELLKYPKGLVLAVNEAVNGMNVLIGKLKLDWVAIKL